MMLFIINFVLGIKIFIPAGTFDDIDTFTLHGTGFVYWFWDAKSLQELNG